MISDHTPRRVVCLQPSATVILAEIGKLDRVVACTKYCAEMLRLCESARGRAGTPVAPSPLRTSGTLAPTSTPRERPARARMVIADSWTAKSEEILAAQPDLVIGTVPYQEKAIAEIMKSGARFLGLAPKSLTDIYADIAVIAGIMGATERGEQVIAKMCEEIEAVRGKARGLNKARVFCEEWGKPIITSQKWVAELVEAAGGDFVGPPGAQTSAKAVARENPEILIAAWCGAGDRVPLEKIVHARGWQGMPAVQQGRVYCIRDEFLNTPAPTLVHGLRALAAAIHPERFPQASGLRYVVAALQ